MTPDQDQSDVQRQAAMLLAVAMWRRFPAAREFIERQTGPWFVLGQIRAEWDWRTDEDRASFDTMHPMMPEPRPGDGLPIRGVRVDGHSVVVSVKGGNDAARRVCGALIDAHIHQRGA